MTQHDENTLSNKSGVTDPHDLAGISADPTSPESTSSDPTAVPSISTRMQSYPNMKWYVVHTHTGQENRAKLSLEERIRQNHLNDKFGTVLIPTENVVQIAKNGQKKTSTRKFFPGYMFVQMELNDDTWHLLKGTARISGFVGDAKNPPAVPESEVLRLCHQIDEGVSRPKTRIHFDEGEQVRVIEGAFQNFNGVVEAVNEEKSKLRVLVSIFGRSTPVELDFIQVEKA